LPFKLTIYLLKVFPFFIFVIFFTLNVLFSNSNIDQVLLIFFFGSLTLCAIFGAMFMFKLIDLACPFCGNLGPPYISENKKLGMNCKSCGEIKTKGLFGLKFKKEKMSNGELRGLKVDLGTFVCGPAKLGDALNKIEPFAQYLKDYETMNDESSGMEIDIKKGKLDSVFITMAKSSAIFLKSGTPISITNRTTVADIKSIFGSPYWVDEDEGEVILFYEYDNGEVELQFEFPKRLPLGFITLMKNGILSNEDQRKSYRVTKTWPPQNPSHK
jgi:hypothetical protein